MDLERGPLSLVSTNEELLEGNSSSSGIENREYDGGIRCTDHATPLYPQKLALISPTSGGRSVGIVRSRTEATEVFFFFAIYVQLEVHLSSLYCKLTRHVSFSGVQVATLR
jgi:hypothetical protein